MSFSEMERFKRATSANRMQSHRNPSPFNNSRQSRNFNSGASFENLQPQGSWNNEQKIANMSSLAGLSGIIAEKSQDVSAIKSFFEEYQSLLRKSKEQGKRLCLLDVLEQLSFLDSNILNGSETQSVYHSLRTNL